MKCISIQRSTFHLNRGAKHNTSKKKKKNARDKCRSTVRKIWQCEPKWSIIFYVWLYLGIKLSAEVFHGLLIKIFAHSIKESHSSVGSSSGFQRLLVVAIATILLWAVTQRWVTFRTAWKENILLEDLEVMENGGPKRTVLSCLWNISSNLLQHLSVLRLKKKKNI